MALDSSGDEFHQNLLLFQRKIGLECYAIRFIDPSSATWAHSSQSQAEEQFSKLEGDQLACIYSFGLGLGHLYLACREWLHANSMRALVFLEDDLRVWRRFLECETAPLILRDPQVHLRVLAQDGKWDGQLAKIATYFSQLPAAIVALPDYERGRPDPWHYLFNRLSELHFSRSLVASQQLNLNTAVYRNFYINFSRMAGAIWGRTLQNRFCKVPAILCGAGPSLDAALPKLRDLQDRALIIGSGSALTALTQAGITPHLGAGLCPEPSEAHRFWHQQGHEVPFLFRSRIDANALFYIHGPHIYLNGCSGAWKTAAWLEQQLGIEGEAIDEGPSVTYLTTQFLHLLGCDPIIYVGLDLALQGERSYSEGVLHGSERPLLEWDRVQRRDLNGKMVDTYWKWIWESNLLGLLVGSLPETTVLNASESGIGVPGASPMALDQVTARYLTRSYDISGRLHAELKGGDHPSISQEAVDAALAQVGESLDRVVERIEKLLIVLRRVEARVVRLAIEALGQSLAGRGEPISPNQPRPWIANGTAALLVREIEEEPAYEAILAPMWGGRTTYLARVYDQFGDRYGPIAVRWRRDLSIEQARWSYLLQCALEQKRMVGRVIAKSGMEG